LVLERAAKKDRRRASFGFLDDSIDFAANHRSTGS
jgi:hypothetical protein